MEIKHLKLNENGPLATADLSYELVIQPHTRHAPVAAISHQNSNLMLFKSLFVKHCATHKL